MASPLRSLPFAAHFLQLPPAIRSSICAGALPRRHFSSSAPRKSALTDIVIAGPTALLDAVHALGVPWYAAIPAVAVLVRSTIGYRLGLLPTRKRHIVRSHLAPLITNTIRQRVGEAMLECQLADQARGGGKAIRAVLMLRRLRYNLWYHLYENHRIGRKFKAPLFSPTMGLNLGLLVLFAEAIRVKCGHREGMLSMLLGPIEKLHNVANDATAKSSAPVLSAEEVIAERMDRAQAAADAQAELYASGTGDVVVDPKLLDPAYHFELMGKTVKTYADSLDPSMLVEGVAWAQNLAVPDSTFILPVMLSATVLIGVFTGDHRAHTVIQPKDRKIETRTDTSAESSGIASPARAAEENLSIRNTEINDAFAIADKMRTDSEARRKTGVVFQKFTAGQKLRIWMAGLFFIVGMNLPAGLLLYMIPSIVVGQLQTRWLDIKHPLPATIQSCRRPMRIKVKKTLADT